MTGGTWEAGTLSVGLAMRLLGTACGSTYTMHVCLGLPFLGGLRIVHFENEAIWAHRLMYMQYAACNVYRSIRERILEWDDMQCVYIREVSERDHKQYVYVCPPSGSQGGSGTETREESGNGTTGIYM